MRTVVNRPLILVFNVTKRKNRVRRDDLRKIRPTHTYNFEELAKVMRRAVSTVQRWKREGMPTIPNSNPALVDGADFKQWFMKRLAARKRPCNLNQFYCMGGSCRVQRLPEIGSVFIRRSNHKIGSVEAKCANCGASIRKGFAMADLAETEKTFAAYEGNVQDLLQYRNRPLNSTK